MTASATHTQLGDGDSDEEMGSTSTTKNKRRQQQQERRRSSSSRDLTPLEQKRALRLEMLTRMIKEFHARHGRHVRDGGGDGGKVRKKSVSISVPATPDITALESRRSSDNDDNASRSSTSDPPDRGILPKRRETPHKEGETLPKGRQKPPKRRETTSQHMKPPPTTTIDGNDREEGNDENAETLLPAINPSPSAVLNPHDTNNSGAGTERRRLLFSSEEGSRDSASIIGSGGRSSFGMDGKNISMLCIQYIQICIQREVVRGYGFHTRVLLGCLQ